MEARNIVTVDQLGAGNGAGSITSESLQHSFSGQVSISEENSSVSILVPAGTPQATRCLICNGGLASTTKGCWNIFRPDIQTAASRQQVHIKLASVLGMELQENHMHSCFICKKCFKLLNDVDTVEVSLEAMKDDIRCKYEDTLKLIGGGGAYQESNLGQSAGKINVDGGAALAPKRRGRPPRRPRPPEDDDEDFQIKSEPKKAKRRKAEETALIVDVKQEQEGEAEVEEAEPEEEESAVLEGSGEFGDDYGESDLSIMDPQAYEDLFTNIAGRFKCHGCDKKFVFAKTASDHMLRVHNLKVHTCDVCLKEFDKKPDLATHLEEHATTEEGEHPFVCEVCPKSFQNPKKYKDHLKFHMMKVHGCEQCGKTFTSRKLLEEHLNAHAGVRPYKCTTCEKCFAYENSLKNHLKLHTYRPRPFTCKDCHKEFLSTYHLQAHRRVHTGQKDHVCETCGKNFSTAYNLESHKVVHTGERPFGCKFCGKTFGRRELLRDHVRIHTGERPFQCEICGATFSKRANFVFHKEASHFNIRRYKCEECNKAFTRRRLLDYHNRSVHTGEKPYKCHLCSAAFVYPHHYKKHLKIHTGEKPFKCEICGKAFNSKENRNAHRFIHSEKKPYECKVCGQGFMRKPALYTHMQSQGHMEDIIIVNQLQLPPQMEQDEEIHIQVHEPDGEDQEQPGVDDMIIVNQYDFPQEGQEDTEAIQYILQGDRSARDIASFVEDGKVEVVLVQTEV